MKPPNLVLRGRLDHNVTTNRGNKQLVEKQNSYRLCLRLWSSIVWTQKAYVEKNNGPACNTQLFLTDTVFVGFFWHGTNHIVYYL